MADRTSQSTSASAVALAQGTRLGPYEVLGPLGAGGMGEVYKARDTRLERSVAIKVLASHLSSSPDLRQRFEREAKAISSLSHPHICTLYDVGHENGTDYLVMEHLDGESLAHRLTRGPLPIEQVLRIGIEVASALDRAHRQGIVHRDLKPGNVVLTKNGAKLLDFGLAKMASGDDAQPGIGSLTSLPTEAAAGTAPLTVEGTLLGTFQYMAPEQLEGQEADTRTDLFALGALLYEMATATPAFAGKSRASLISAIMTGQPPPVSSVQPLTPPALDRVIRTCLAKDRDDRWQTAHDVMLQLQWIAEGGSQAGLPAPVAARRARREHVAWAVAAVAALAAVALAFVGFRTRPQELIPARFMITVPRGVATIGLASISPDGRALAFNAIDSTGHTMIWIRRLNSLDAQPLPGTEGAQRPWWSPDSRYVAFMSGQKAKKVAIAGGPAETIGNVTAQSSDGTWGRGGVILYDGGALDPLRRIPASGGVSADAVPADSSAQPAWPEFLPDGRHFVMSVGPQWELSVGELGKKTFKRLGVRGSRVEYSDGHLLFVRDRSLVAQRFDTGKLALVGEPFPIADPVNMGGNAFANFSVSENGVLAYRGLGLATSHLSWVDQTGHELGRPGPTADYRAPDVSPDGKRIAIRRRDGESGNADVWILDPTRGTATRFTFDPAAEGNPTWSPDGKQIAFTSDRGGNGVRIYVKSSSGVGEERVIPGVAGDFVWTDSWSPDGKYLLASVNESQSGLNLWLIPMTGDAKPSVFLRTPFNEGQSQFSPDGRWIAYASDESGRLEVYVQSFLGSEGKWQISTEGGSQPHWSPNGKELYYIGADQRLLSVEIQTSDSFSAGVPKPMFPMRTQAANIRNEYDVAPDGRLLLVVPDEDALTPTTIVMNWRAGMNQR